jgi:hypothetical protein
MWQVHLNWLKTGISIRYADTADFDRRAFPINVGDDCLEC